MLAPKGVKTMILLVLDPNKKGVCKYRIIKVTILIILVKDEVDACKCNRAYLNQIGRLTNQNPYTNSSFISDYFSRVILRFMEYSGVCSR